MKVIILCGGEGTRLKEETEFKPKPLLTIGNLPMIVHIMGIYNRYGYNDFILPVGYKGYLIKEYFNEFRYRVNDFTIDYSTNQITFHKKTNNFDLFNVTIVDTGDNSAIGSRILQCKDYIGKDDFMVTYGDGLSDINISNLVEFHKFQKTIGTITGVHPKSKFGALEVNGDKITGVFEKPVLHDWVNGGFMVFKNEFLQYLRHDEMEHPALQRLAEKSNLSIYKYEGFWYAIDTHKEYEELNKIYKSEGAKWEKS